MGLLDRMLTMLLGGKCPDGCGLRVYPKQKDREEHREKYCRVAG